MRKQFLFFSPGILWIIICTVLLTLPGSSFPKEDWLDKIWFDKWVHIGLFGLIVISWGWGCYKTDRTNKQLLTAFLWITFAASGYGIAMEFVQKYLVINRSFDTGDIIADTVGALTGYFFCRKVFKKN